MRRWMIRLDVTLPDDADPREWDWAEIVEGGGTVKVHAQTFPASQFEVIVLMTLEDHPWALTSVLWRACETYKHLKKGVEGTPETFREFRTMLDSMAKAGLVVKRGMVPKGGTMALATWALPLTVAP
jgi:hypothetical protein